MIEGSKMDEELRDYENELDEVRKKLSKLKPSKSSGSDNIHPVILKEMSGVLDKPWAILYQKYWLKKRHQMTGSMLRLQQYSRKENEESQITTDQ